MELAITILTNAAFVSAISNLVTMFIDDKKLAAAGPLTKALVGFLNALALNVCSPILC